MKMNGNFRHNGVILLSGEDQPGVTEKLFSILEPFNIEIQDVEQVIIRGRLILTLQIGFDKDHGGAIAQDLEESFKSTNLDLAMDFSSVASEIKKENSYNLVLLSRELKPRSIAAIARVISKYKGNIENIRRTATQPVTAIEFEISFNIENQFVELRQELAELAFKENFDVAIQEASIVKRAKRIVLLDMDSTLIQEEVIDLLAGKVGVGSQVSQITERAMRGEIDFSTSLRERVALLKGAPLSIITEVASQINLTPGARTLIATLHKLGHKVGVVSGGFLNVIEPLLIELEIDFYKANFLKIQDGVLTGELEGDIIDRKAKGEALKEFADKEKVDLKQTIAIGDGANDLAMIELAGLGIAFNAKPAVRAAADTSISNPFLDSVLYLIGVSRTEIEALLN